MYIIIEIQEQTEGCVPNTISYTASSLDEAMSKYHYVLHYASVSDLFRHGAVIMSTDGKYIARESYKHAGVNTGGDDNGNA